MSKTSKNFDKDGFRLHRWNPEDIFDLTNNSKYWKKTILEEIKSKGGAVRKRLGNRLRNQLRIIPALEFYIDDSLDYEDNISKLLKE